jgi:thymidylate synthase ThyX
VSIIKKIKTNRKQIFKNMKKKISAEIIADSKNEFGQRITTFVVTFPRIVLAEFNTHRMLSRNSASSRAIPFKKMVEMVDEDPFIPMAFQKDHSGMQGTEYFNDKDTIDSLRDEWVMAKDDAVHNARRFNDIGVTKQLCNRLLEPFMWHTVICTGTEWENFFALRAHEAAEIHISDLAQKMLDLYNKSDPKQLKAGEWHIPFGNNINDDRVFDLANQYDDPNLDSAYEIYRHYAVKIATARCARVSYNNFEGNDDYNADVKLHDRLLSMGHMSPFEHCARAMNEDEYYTSYNGSADHSIVNNRGKFLFDKNGNSIEGWSGNFRGFIQYRKMLQSENKKDSRVLVK